MVRRAFALAILSVMSHGVFAQDAAPDLDLSERFRMPYWDAAIIAAAERLQAEVVYSEDFNHGQSYGRVRVVNPYL
jgi:predicted nucleic acid-binding protein